MIRMTIAWTSLLFTLALIAPACAAEMSAEEARAFIAELTAYVQAHHLKADAASPQAGMVYEYVDTTRLGQTGQWIQGEALDTMHDGAWYAAALCCAYRATGDPQYREFLLKWQIPFYTKVLNQSDVLFRDGLDPAKAAPAKNLFGKEHRYLGEKGFCPYFWDDGASVTIERDTLKDGRHAFECVDYYRLAGEPNPDLCLKGFSLGCSNHMAQDLAVMLLETWLLARDPAIAEAAMNLHKSRLLHHGPIPAVMAAAAWSNHDEVLRKQIPVDPKFEPRNDYTLGLYAYEKDKPWYLPGFADNQEYIYYSALAKHEGTLSRAAAARIIYDAVTLPLLVRYWADTGPEVPPGMNRAEAAVIQMRNGKISPYRSDRDIPFGSRMGPQNLVVTAWALQALRAYPGVWEERYRQEYAGDLLVRFLDEPPALDGTPEPGYSQPISADGLSLRLASDRNDLYLAGRSTGAAAAITLFSQPDAQGRSATFQIDKSGTVRAANNEGAELLHKAKVVARGDGFDFEVRLPYTVVKEQAAWLTGIEHGRYSVRIGAGVRNLYFLSTEDQVQRALHRELVDGLANWREVWRREGFIAVALGERAWKYNDTRVNKVSDLGGYAHLVKAAAEYLLYLDGKSDWQSKAPP